MVYLSRRSFIKKTGLATAGVLAAPYILPSGRLFAASGTRLVNHVVFVLFAGGIRHQESIDQAYLATQNLPYTGNVMENMLAGAPPSLTQPFYQRWNPILNNPLVTQGTLYREMRYAEGPTGHYNGHTAAVTGSYTGSSLNLNVNPDYPTVFEYYRKHNDPAKSAINSWWMSEGLGPYPSLNYSRHGMYGPQYGANYFRPLSTFYSPGLETIGNGANFQPDDVTKINGIKNFLNANFERSVSDLPGIRNSDEDKYAIEAFVKETLADTQNGTIDWPKPASAGLNELNGDLINIAYAWKVMQAFHPELMVINTFNADICHDNFSQSLQDMHKADYGVGWLWNKIQSDPLLANDTIMICMPDHGRNLNPNNITDANGLRAFDHTNEENNTANDNARRTFALIVGPPNKVKQNQVIGSAAAPQGENIDVVPTIAHILGFNDQIPGGMLAGSPLMEAFV